MRLQENERRKYNDYSISIWFYIDLHFLFQKQIIFIVNRVNCISAELFSFRRRKSWHSNLSVADNNYSYIGHYLKGKCVNVCHSMITLSIFVQVNERGFPTVEGLVALYSEGVDQKEYILATLQAVNKCLTTAQRRHLITPQSIDGKYDPKCRWENSHRYVIARN